MTTDPSTDKAAPTYTITVPCSYCHEPVEVSGTVGAVMPDRHDGATVAAFIPNWYGAHRCASERHAEERAIHDKYACRWSARAADFRSGVSS